MSIKENKALLVILTASILLYSKSIFFGFINLDDNIYIYVNPEVQNFGWQSLKHFFTNFVYGHYHPITMSSYGVQHAIHGLQAEYYHLVNVIIHLIAVIFCYKVIGKLIQQKEVVVAATALFALHPLQVESVAWVGTRGTILNGLFSLISIYYYLLYIDNKFRLKDLLASTFFLLIALLSKSNAILLPLVFFVFDYFKERKFTFNLLLEKIPYLLLSLIFGIIAILAARDLGTVAKSFEGSFIENLGQRFFFILYSASFYFNKFFFPANLSAMHYDPQPIDGGYHWSFYLSSLFFVLAIFVLLFRFFQTKNRIYSFTILYYFISYILVINIIPLGGTIASERYAYISNLSLMLFVPWAFYHGLKKYSLIRLSKFLGWSVILIYTIISFFRMDVWSDSKLLYTDIKNKYPNSSHALAGYASAMIKEANYEEAMEYLNKAIELSPQASYFSERAVLKMSLDSMESALEDITQALIRNPRGEDIYLRRALINQQDGNLMAAIKDYSLVVEMQPKNSDVWLNRGLLKFAMGDFKGGCEDWKKAEQLGSEFAREGREKNCFDSYVEKNKITVEQKVYNEIKHENGEIGLRIINHPNKEGMLLQRFDTLGNLVEQGEVDKRGKYNGLVEWFYPNGNLKVSGYYKDIFPMGEWQEYYESGQLKIKYYYKGGTLDSNYSYFYENGNLWTEKIYKQGKLIEVKNLLSQNGESLDIGTFSNGSGVLYIYDFDGLIIDSTEYKNGKILK